MEIPVELRLGQARSGIPAAHRARLNRFKKTSERGLLLSGKPIAHLFGEAAKKALAIQSKRRLAGDQKAAPLARHIHHDHVRENVSSGLEDPSSGHPLRKHS